MDAVRRSLMFADGVLDHRIDLSASEIYPLHVLLVQL